MTLFVKSNPPVQLVAANCRPRPLSAITMANVTPIPLWSKAIFMVPVPSGLLE
jgi:hypothetical protein